MCRLSHAPHQVSRARGERPQFESLEARMLFSSNTVNEVVTSSPAHGSADNVASLDAGPATSVSPLGSFVAQAVASTHFPKKFTKAAAAPRARFEGYNEVINGKLYSMGGFDSKFRALGGLDVFDPATKTWSTVKGFKMHAAATHAGVANDNGVLYFAGGFTGDLGKGRAQPVTRTAWRYDPADNGWTKMPPLPGGRGAGALVRLGRYLHFFGGCFGDRVTNSETHWVLYLGKHSTARDDGTRWIKKPGLPSPRDHLSGIVVNNKLYAIGGEFGHDVDHIQTGLVDCWDPSTDSWKRMASLPMPRSHIEDGVFEMNGKIIVAGGQVDDYQPTNDVEQYDAATNTWSSMTPLPAPRQGGAIQKIG